MGANSIALSLSRILCRGRSGCQRPRARLRRAGSASQIVANATICCYDDDRDVSTRSPAAGCDPASDLEGADLRRLIQTFIRSAGLLAGDQTPCGHPVAVSHAHALMVLLETARKGKRVTQRELGQALGIDKSNVTRLCRRMESAGHLVQSRSADDGRARLLSLTTRGTRVAKNVERSSRDRFQAADVSHSPKVPRRSPLLARLPEPGVGLDGPTEGNPPRPSDVD